MYPKIIVIIPAFNEEKSIVKVVEEIPENLISEIIVAANYGNYPKCSIVETSLGPAKVYDTGGFAARYPNGFDLATDWSIADGI